MLQKRNRPRYSLIQHGYIYTLYFMSDCYLGLDQQYDIYLNVTQASLSAQVNTEVSDDLAVE
ncbi:activating signal cointegrator 1 complex subunit [Saguinus oedipus]|uniref:Activating signal cointegrator 1 complex subunit n=1 Tax=Saguinus oedipus TaxID=9490 RepID=A0ABQ9VXN1_SAGOE|nr:activating signal cointegrator 1 complex subunit [Saguinus oedipus]